MGSQICIQAISDVPPILIFSEEEILLSLKPEQQKKVTHFGYNPPNTTHTPVLISSLYYHITPHIIPLSSDLYILSLNIWLASLYVNVPMKPASFHLLCVVLHVALQSDTLWCALKNQVRGRGTCNQTHKTFKLQ